jgi:hypothetical protein
MHLAVIGARFPSDLLLITFIATTMHVVEFLKQFLLTLGGTAVAVAAVAWLARSIITHWLSKDVEVYKTRLQAESAVALERIRSELQILAARRNIEYSRIHEKRLEIIAELVSKISAFHERVSAYVSEVEWGGAPSKEERRKLTAEAFADFNKYFIPRRFFLPKPTVQKVEAFRAGLYKTSVDFMFYVEYPREHKTDLNKDVDVWTQASDYTLKEAPKLIADLEDEFRNILGIEQP